MRDGDLPPSAEQRARRAGKERSVRVQWTEIPAADVIRHFVKGYQNDTGEIVDYEWFFDASKGRVILKLFVEERGKGSGGER